MGSVGVLSEQELHFIGWTYDAIAGHLFVCLFVYRYDIFRLFCFVHFFFHFHFSYFSPNYLVWYVPQLEKVVILRTALFLRWFAEWAVQAKVPLLRHTSNIILVITAVPSQPSSGTSASLTSLLLTAATQPQHQTLLNCFFFPQFFCPEGYLVE